MNKEARIVNGCGNALAVIGWIGFVRVLALEIVMVVKRIDASEQPRAEVKPIATVEILWIGMLVLAAFGYGLRLIHPTPIRRLTPSLGRVAATVEVGGDPLDSSPLVGSR